MKFNDGWKRLVDNISGILETIGRAEAITTLADATKAGASASGVLISLFVKPALDKLQEGSERKLFKALEDIIQQAFGDLEIDRDELQDALENVKKIINSRTSEPQEKYLYPMLYGPIPLIKQALIEICKYTGKDELAKALTKYDGLVRKELGKDNWKEYFDKENEAANAANWDTYLLSLMNERELPLTQGQSRMKDIYVDPHSYMLRSDQWGPFEVSQNIRIQNTEKHIIDNYFGKEVWKKRDKQCLPILYISANYGVGKTTFLKNFAANLAEKKHKREIEYFPVFMNVRLDMLNLIPLHMETYDGIDLGASGPYIFLLDSIDESDAYEGSQLATLFHNFASLLSNYKKSWIVTTSRPVGGQTGAIANEINNKNGEFLYLSGFNEAQVDEYIGKYRKSKVDVKIPEKLTYNEIRGKLLRDESDISKPLFINMILHIFEAEELDAGKLNEQKGLISRVELYLMFMNSLSATCKRPKSESENADIPDNKLKYRYIIRKIAAMRQILEMHTGQKTKRGEKPREHVDGLRIDKIKERLPNSDEAFFEEIEEERYLLLSHFGERKQDGYTRIEFSHKSFREYLLAEYMLEVFIRREDKSALCIGYISKEALAFFIGLIELFVKTLSLGNGEKNPMKDYFHSISKGWEHFPAVLNEQYLIARPDDLMEKMKIKAREWLENETVYVTVDKDATNMLNARLMAKNVIPSKEHTYCERWYSLLFLHTAIKCQNTRQWISEKDIIGKNLESLLLESLHLESIEPIKDELNSGITGYLGKAKLVDAKLVGANLRGAKLRGANLGDANLAYANLRDANLAYANLRDANLAYANLRDANLWGANLAYANLGGANLRGANLVGANLEGANLRGARLGGANLEGAELVGAELVGAELVGARLRVANLRGANLEGAELVGAKLRGANLERANLEGARLAYANLWGANLVGARLGDAELGGANLGDANLRGAQGLTKNQIKSAIVDGKTKLPDYIKNN